jgi:hypothetical protein
LLVQLMIAVVVGLGAFIMLRFFGRSSAPVVLAPPPQLFTPPFGSSGASSSTPGEPPPPPTKGRLAIDGKPTAVTVELDTGGNITAAKIFGKRMTTEQMETYANTGAGHF